MRFGLLIEGSTVSEITGNVARGRQDGFTSAWLTDGIGFDPLTVLAVVGQNVPTIELGTAVVRTIPRHPMALAQHAMTVNSVVGGRLLLGVGPSHRPSIEQVWGLSFDNVMGHTRDYLSILTALVRTGTVDHTGKFLHAHSSLYIDGGQGLPVLVGALGEQMLRLSGAMADGTVTFLTGPRTLAGFTCPIIRAAADAAGRPAPRIVAMLPVVVTDDLDAARDRVARGHDRMLALPSYKAAVEREGTIPIVGGSEDQVRDELGALAAAGVTDVVPTHVARRGSDDEARTSALVLSLSTDGPG